MSNYEKMLYKKMYSLGLVTPEKCSDEESELYRQLLKEKKPLPDNITYVEEINRTVFYHKKMDYTQEQIETLLMCKKVVLLKSIKNILMFLSVIAALFVFFFVAKDM